MSQSINQGVANIINPEGTSDFVLICEHASCHIGEDYQNLGLEQAQIRSHIGWDIGAQKLSEQLAQQLNAPLIVQSHSRLLYDCNRPPSSDTAIPKTSETTAIPGNAKLTTEQKQHRADTYYFPFHQSIKSFLDQRAQHQPVFIVTIHSFNPVYQGIRRHLDIGFIHDQDALWAEQLVEAAQSITAIKTALNQPYSAADEVTHTLQMHGTARSVPNVMIEIKNDLIHSSAGQQRVADILERLLKSNTPYF